MRPDVKQLAIGRWPGVLAALGVPAETLSGKHGPCPMCGGRDRFRFDDKEGRGTWICSKCNAGDGFKFVMSLCVDFQGAADLVREVLPTAPEVHRAKERGVDEKRAALRRVWEQARAVQPGDPVHTYLAGWDLPHVPQAGRHVPQMAYYRDGRKVAAYDAMVAAVRAGRQVPEPAHHLPRGGKEGPRRPAAEGDAAGRDDRRRRGR